MGEAGYVGEELDVFSHALNWKAYVRKRLGPWIRGDVLEVGSGLGSTTRALCDGTPRSWTCLEPDPELAAQQRAGAAESPLPMDVGVRVGILTSLAAEEQFDTILYIDVLEHIEDDDEELLVAQAHLRPGGALVVLSPAFQFLFSPFDQAVGHHRRYTKKTLRAVIPPGLKRAELFYMDSVGMLASLVNRVFLKQTVPNLDQIRVWDRFLVRASRLVDPLVLHAFGRSVVAVYTEPGRSAPREEA